MLISGIRYLGVASSAIAIWGQFNVSAQGSYLGLDALQWKDTASLVGIVLGLIGTVVFALPGFQAWSDRHRNAHILQNDINFFSGDEGSEIDHVKQAGRQLKNVVSLSLIVDSKEVSLIRTGLWLIVSSFALQGFAVGLPLLRGY